MSKSIESLLSLIREADEAAAPAGSEKIELPGADAQGEKEVSLDAEVEDLDEPMADKLLPEEEKIDDADGKVAAPAVEAPPAQPEAGDSSAELSKSSEVSAEEFAADVDPDVAEIIRALGESDELISEEESEEDESEEKSDEEKKDDEDSDSDFSDVDNISLSDDESKEVSDAASADEAPADAEKKEEAALPGSEDLSDEQKGCLRRLFDSCVAEAVQAKFPKLIKLVEGKLNAKFKTICEQREADLNQKVNHYLRYVVETWKEENKPQLHTAAQVKVAQKIFESLKTITETLNIETIDAQAALVKEYEEQIAKLKSESNKLVSENAKLVKEMSIKDRAIIIEEASKGLPLTEVSGFKAAVANIKAEDLQTFKENVQVVRASLVAKPKKSEGIRATNESLALQGGLKGGSTSSQSEGDLIANLIPDASENNK